MSVAVAPTLRIGLVNNMPAAAQRATERQFRSLILEADEGRAAAFVPFRLAGAGCSQEGVVRATPSALEAAGLDALIVTGAEPQAADLRAEPFWRDLAEVADWAAARPIASYWSCLAAHAAVLHLDGVARRPLAAKLSGVFEIREASTNLGSIRVPHSRFNGLDEHDLVACGYVVRSRSAQVGVDAFVRPGPGLLLLHQGHPEYAGNALGIEWRRDLRRFLAGERPTAPDPPETYYGATLETAIRDLWRPSDRAAARACLERVAGASVDSASWRADAVRLFRSWLEAARPATAAARERAAAGTASVARAAG